MLMVSQFPTYSSWYSPLRQRLAVGSLPPGFNDPLQPDGLAAFSQGLRVQTCRATPSLGTVPPTTVPANPPTSSPPISCPPSTQCPPASCPPTSCPSSPASTATVTFYSTVTQTVTSTTTQTLAPTACVPGGGNPQGGGTQVCVEGRGPGNYAGLCSFSCHYGYCPLGPCICTRYGDPVSKPPSTGVRGVPLPGEDDSYSGLCSFTCDHGYCPPTACTTA